MASVETLPAPRVAAVPGVPIIRPASIDLRSFSAARREPPRPPHLRLDGYEEKFDAETLVFDAFHAMDRRVVLMGPPFLNLKDGMARMRVTALPSGVSCRFELREMDRHGQIHVTVPDGTERLVLDTPFGRTEAAVQPSELDRFAGRRVLLTQSRNNDLAWIQDWIRFGRDSHGADAVLIYDNGSDRYPLEALAEAVGAVGGMAAAAVVSWPFKFGPQSVHRRHWDSDFTQHGVLEHARRRFLEGARAVQSSDVDEFVLPAGSMSVFEAAERSRLGIVRYRGDWIIEIEGAPRRPDGSVRHTDFTTLLKTPPRRRLGVLPAPHGLCPYKWTLVPARCPDKAQWGIHAVGGWMPGHAISWRWSYRHFRPISNSWKYKRSDTAAFDPARHARDEALIALCRKVDWDR